MKQSSFFGYVVGFFNFSIMRYLLLLATVFFLSSISEASLIESKKTFTATKGEFYVRDHTQGIGNTDESIIEQLDHILRVECLLQCGRVKGCHHVAINADLQRCNLLRDLTRLDAENMQFFTRLSTGKKAGKLMFLL